MKHARKVLFALTISSSLTAQTSADSTQKTFFTKRDLVYTGAALATSAAVSIFDERIARWTQSARVQGDSARRNLADNITVINETPLTLGFAGIYLIGRVTGHETVADVGLHTAESLALTVGLAEAIRAR